MSWSIAVYLIRNVKWTPSADGDSEARLLLGFEIPVDMIVLGVFYDLSCGQWL